MNQVTEIDTIARVVVAEPDNPTRELLAESLRADRYDAVEASGPSEILQACAEGVDVVVIDSSLRRALELLRFSLASQPVVIMLGDASDGDIAVAVADGAEDYLGKPFDYAELLTRIRVIQRRARGEGYRDGVYRHDGIVVDVASRTVEVGEAQVLLTTKEFELLRKLVVDPRRVFTKDELLAEIWGYRPGTPSRTLDSHASRLRRKLCTAGGGEFIQNCWGVGYRLLPS